MTRGEPRQAKILKAFEVEAMTERLARSAGEAIAAVPGATVVDAIVMASRGGYFSDLTRNHRPWGYVPVPMLEVMIVLVAAVLDLFRPRRSLLAENALLRHQLAIVRRSVLRPRTTRLDRLGLVVLAALTPLTGERCCASSNRRRCSAGTVPD